VFSENNEEFLYLIPGQKATLFTKKESARARFIIILNEGRWLRGGRV
jgi:hypothetical protein